MMMAVLPAEARAAAEMEPLERQDDPPMRIWRNDASPAMISQHGAYTSQQVNVDAEGRNITGDAANEPSITVDPTNHNNMAVGWRQFDSVASNFRQAGWGFTSNGGKSWSFPGVLERGVFRSDPVLSSDESGRFFYLSLLTTFYDNMWRSLDSGRSWANLGFGTGGDKQWFTIDQTASSGHGFQYQAWSTAGNNYPGRQFSRSVDGGVTWIDPVPIPNAPIWGTLDVDTSGNLYIGGVNVGMDQFWCVRSTNAKNAAVTPTFDRSTVVNLGGQILSSGAINPIGLTGQVFLAVDRSSANSRNNIYMLASVRANGATNGSDVMFARSTDGGRTFSSPRRLNDDRVNQNKWHWFGTLAVAPNGRIDAVWLDSRNAPNNTDSQLFYTYSRDGGVSWAANIEVSDPFNPFIGYPNQNKMGDYITLVSDEAGADVAYTATFNGEQDVYYVRVAPPTSQLLNISSRAAVQTGERVTIAGFIVSGTEAKKVIVRGLVPSLNGVEKNLADPTLELHQGNSTLATNDNWKVKDPTGESQEAEIRGTSLAPSNDAEAAIVAALEPGQYTAILAGKGGTTGAALVEVYDLARDANAKLANLSTRAFVGTDDNVLIGGFIMSDALTGGGRVIVRALGPSLGSSGIQGALPDPTLALYDANGVALATNDNWKVDDNSGVSQEAAIRATTLPPTNDFESAIVATLPAGAHTAIVRGKDNTVGVGLVEVFSLP